MKYLKVYELFAAKKHYKVTEDKHDKSDFYYFTTDNDWIYEVGFYKRDFGYFMGFKAKRPQAFSFDFDVMTNDNPFKVLSTIAYIIEQHYEKYKPEKYMFSVQSSNKKKGNQRAIIYMKMLEQLPEWNVEKDPDMQRWAISKK